MARDHAAECRTWNADHDHQVQAGHASFAAFSTRMRAVNGGPQLFPQQAAKYVAPHEIGLMGRRVPPVLQTIIHTAWAHGVGWGVEHWLLPAGATPPPPDGALFAAGSAQHDWRAFAPGWLVCDGCWLAAICPLCQPTWMDDAVVSRLLQALCIQHHGGA